MSADPSDLARQLAARRKRAAFTCAECGEPFEAIARGGPLAPLYCSDACRNRVKNRRRRTRAAQDN